MKLEDVTDEDWHPNESFRLRQRTMTWDNAYDYPGIKNSVLEPSSEVVINLDRLGEWGEWDIEEELGRVEDQPFSPRYHG